MKKILFIALLSFINCKAQNPIINLETPGFLPKTRNAYYKDVDNYLSQFAGTWAYNNGNTTLKIVIQKKEMKLMPGGFFEDMLIGEYRYIKDGVEKVSTLPNLDVDFPDPYGHRIVGNLMQGKMGNPLCFDCSDTDRKVVRLYFYDPITKLNAELYLRYLGNNQMRIFIRQKMILSTPEHPVTNTIMTVPTGEYIMTRQQ